MTTEKNKRACKLLGICWHEVDAMSCPIKIEISELQGGVFKRNIYICKKCGKEYSHNPDFTVNAKDLLEAMKEKLGEERYEKFVLTVGVKLKMAMSFKIGYAIYEYYILNPRQLCEEALDFLEGK